MKTSWPQLVLNYALVSEPGNSKLVFACEFAVGFNVRKCGSEISKNNTVFKTCGRGLDKRIVRDVEEELNISETLQTMKVED